MSLSFGVCKQRYCPKLEDMVVLVTVVEAVNNDLIPGLGGRMYLSCRGSAQ
jgi:hypothetical protein